MESFNTADYLNEDAAVSEQFNFGISGDDTVQVQITDEVFNLINTVAHDVDELTVAHDVDEFLFSAECANTERYNPQTSEINDKICKRQCEVKKEVETDKKHMKKN